jgi:hypothetical protein
VVRHASHSRLLLLLAVLLCIEVLLLKRIGILPILGMVLLVALAPEAVTEFCKVVAEAILRRRFAPFGWVWQAPVHGEPR